MKELYGLKYVTWVDSSLCHEQVSKGDIPTPVEIYTVGFVVDETDDHITLARDVLDSSPSRNDLRALVAIPKAAVRGIRTVHMQLTQAPMPSHEFPSVEYATGYTSGKVEGAS